MSLLPTSPWWALPWLPVSKKNLPVYTSIFALIFTDCSPSAVYLLSLVLCLALHFA